MNYTLIRLVGLSYMITSTIIMSGTYIIAFSNPSKTTIVDINKYGELMVEPFFILLGVLCWLLLMIDKKWWLGAKRGIRQ